LQIAAHLLLHYFLLRRCFFTARLCLSCTAFQCGAIKGAVMMTESRENCRRLVATVLVFNDCSRFQFCYLATLLYILCMKACTTTSGGPRTRQLHRLTGGGATDVIYLGAPVRGGGLYFFGVLSALSLSLASKRRLRTVQYLQQGFLHQLQTIYIYRVNIKK